MRASDCADSEKPRFGYRRLHVLLGRAGAPHLPQSWPRIRSQEAQALRASEQAANDLYSGEPGMGA